MALVLLPGLKWGMKQGKLISGRQIRESDQPLKQSPIIPVAYYVQVQNLS